MQRSAEGQDDLLRLFDDAAEYVEPSTGQLRRHRGRAALKAWFSSSWIDQPPDIAPIERIDVDDEQVRAAWTCNSPAFAVRREVSTPTRFDLAGSIAWKPS